MRPYQISEPFRGSNPAGAQSRGLARPKASGCFAALTVAVAAALMATIPSFATTTSTATWTNATGDNNWFTAANWSFSTPPSPLAAPNNGSGGISDYNVIVGAPSPTDISGGTVTLDSLTINTNGVLNTSAATGLATTLDLVGPGGFSNAGTVNVAGSLQLQAAALQGSGTIALEGGATPASLTLQLPYSASISPTTSITSNNTIIGAGTITVYSGDLTGFINSGTVDAGTANGILSVAGPSDISNQGVFEATNGGTLSLGTVNVTQTATGEFYAHGGTVMAWSLDGGTVSTDNGGSLSAVAFSGSTTNPLDISQASTVKMTSGTSYLSGNIINNGTIDLGGTANTYSHIDLNGDTAIGGTGSVVLSGGTLNVEKQGGTSTSDDLTLGPSQTLSGTGGLIPNSGVALTNDGTVNADVAGGTLGLSLLTNNGTMEATNGGTLQLESVAQSTTGVIDAAGGNVQVAGVSGGTLESAPGYAINLVSPVSVPSPGGGISGTTENPLTVSSGSSVIVAATEFSPDNVGVSGSIVNDGAIQIEGPSPNDGVIVAALSLNADTEISGAGSIILSNNGGILASQFSNPTQPYTLTIGSQQTLSGSGFLGATSPSPTGDAFDIANNGTINADGTAGGLAVGTTNGNSSSSAPTSVTNNGVLEATHSGTLYLEAPAISQSATGVIYANGGTVSIGALSTEFYSGGPVVDGGSLRSAPGSEIQSDGSFVLGGGSSNPTTITDGTVVDAPLVVTNRGEFVAPTFIQISGTVTNNGLVRIGDDPSGVFPQNYPFYYPSPGLILRPNSTVSGTGSVVIAPSPYQIYNQQHPSSTQIPDSQLHESELAVNATEFGTGVSVVDNQLTNGGIVLASGTGGTLELQAGNTNNGTYEAQGGGTLQVDSGTLSNYSSGTLTGGTYEAVSGGDLNLAGADILTNAANVTLDGATSAFAAIAPMTQNTGSFTLSNAAVFTTVGDFANTGTLAVMNGASFVVSGKLTNSGTISLDPSTITVNGDMILQSGGTLVYDLSGSASGPYDQVNVLGAARLAGSLNVNVFVGFTPTLGETFTILTASNGITGSFSQNTITSGQDVFQVQYGNGVVQLDTTAVPEPAALALFALGGLSLLVRRHPRSGCIR